MAKITYVFLFLILCILLLEPICVLGQDNSFAVPSTASTPSPKTSQSCPSSTYPSCETTTTTTTPNTATTIPNSVTIQIPTPVDNEATSLQAMTSSTKTPPEFLPNPIINLVNMLPDLGELKGILMGFAMRQELTPCTADLVEALQAAQRKELWALQLFDSWGKPGPSLMEYRFQWVGDYNQCRSTKSPPRLGKEGYKGDYCVLKLMILNETIGIQFWPAIGVCVPDTCSEEEVTFLTQGLIEAVNLGHVVRVAVTQSRNDHREATAATVIAIIVLVMLGIILLSSTALDLIFIQWPKWQMSRDLGERKENVNASDKGKEGKAREHSESKDTEKEEVNSSSLGKRDNLDTTGTHNSVPVLGACNERNPLMKRDGDFWKSKRGKILVSFSLYTNCDRLFNTSQDADSVSCIFGMRVFICSWIMFIHIHELLRMQNLLEVYQTLASSWIYEILTNVIGSIYMYHTISGFLVGYWFYKTMMKNGWRINWGKALLHRYLRLTPPYALVLLVAMGLKRYMGSGALWDTDQPMEKNACEKYWWMNLLYISNLFGLEDRCMLESWSLSVDFQLYLLAPALLIPLYLNKYAGVAVAFASLLMSWIVSGVITARYELGLHCFLGPKSGDFQKFVDFFTYFHTPFYTNIGPYVVGMLAGWWLAFTDRKVRLPRYVVVVGWIASIAITLTVQFNIHDDINPNKEPLPMSVRILYNALCKTAWGLSTSWFIVACSLGYGVADDILYYNKIIALYCIICLSEFTHLEEDPICEVFPVGFANKVLTSPPMIVMGRLCYMMYLCHRIIIDVFFGNMEKPLTWTKTTMVIVFHGVFAVSTTMSFLLHLIIEAPSMNFFRLVISK